MWRGGGIVLFGFTLGEAGEALMDHSVERVLLGVEGEEGLFLLVC